MEAEGHDLQSLLYAFLDELLFVFSTDLLVFKEVRAGLGVRPQKHQPQLDAAAAGEDPGAGPRGLEDQGDGVRNHREGGGAV